MLLSFDKSGPVYQQLYRALRQSILNGQIKAASRLPSSRDLAAEMSISRNTVLLAYEQLLAEGYLVGRVGAGTFVAERLPTRETNQSVAPVQLQSDYSDANLSNYARRAVYAPYRIVGPSPRSIRFDFKYGVSSVKDFPFEIWRKLLSNRARASSSDAFMYGPPEGSAHLREALASYLRRSRGVGCSPEQILVVNGSQQALDLVTRALIDPGDITIIEDPNYPGARDVFLAAGSQLIPVPVEPDGLSVDHFPAAARRARLAYVTPSHQFPTGAVMSLSRRLALLSWAQESGAYIIEDDYDSEFKYDGRPIEAVQALNHDGPVIYVGTLSKTLSPSLRVGYLVVPKQLIHPLRTIKFLSDRHTSTLQQNVLTDFINEGHFERHLRRARRSNARRRAVLIEALQKEFGNAISISGANAGLHMVVWFQNIPYERTEHIVQLAASSKVGVYSIAPYYINAPTRAGLLLGYAALDEADIREGIEQLANCLRSKFSELF